MYAALLLGTAATNAADGLGRQIADFTLRDCRGQSHALADCAKSKLVVVAFLGVECPLANVYAPRLVALAEKYSPRGVAFLAIDSNRQDSISELAAYAAAHRFPFPVLKDPGNVVADQFGALRTPEVFVLDGQRAIRYRGRIDDQYEVGLQRAKAIRHDLAEAIEALLAGREVRQPRTTAPGCFIGRVAIAKRSSAQADPDDAVPTWSAEISRIVQRRCQECHRPGQLAPFPLLDYDDAIGWAETIREVVALGRMPPWNANPAYGRFANDLRLSDDEKQQIIQWVDAGGPEGDPRDLPEPRRFESDWRIGRPDQVVYMSRAPFAVKAEGVVDYQWFYVDPGFAEDKWVSAVEARPGCRGVVHHITIYHKPPGGKWDMKHNTRINLLGGFNPGGEPLILPEGMAIRLVRGTQLAFEMHYTPNGIPQQDRSYVGLRFADPRLVRKEVRCYMPADTKLSIPPRTRDHRSEVRYRFEDDMDLLLMRPHMHLRGRSFRYEALLPDGTREVLLDVPRFDFNWQHSYYLAQPKRLPRGTELRCIAHYDNSEENPTNPNPAATVRWGDQSWDEMMIGIFCAVLSDQDLRRHPLADGSGHRDLRWTLAAGGVMATCLGLVLFWRHRRRRR
jgi:peroxiredoxin